MQVLILGGTRFAGLRLRPLAETIRDTLAWDQARGGPAPEMRA